MKNWPRWTLLTLAIGFVLWLFPAYQLAHRKSLFVSCRNHSSFVLHAIQRHIELHGHLPHEEGIDGELLFCRLSFWGHWQNCRLGAPDQAHGGWQMVNAPEQVWHDIIANFNGPSVPVLWCGQPHRRSIGEEPRRIVIQWRRPQSMLGAIFGASARPREGDLEIVYGLEESELQSRLAQVDALLERHGVSPTTLNVTSQVDYAELAAPYQSEEFGDEPAPKVPEPPR